MVSEHAAGSFDSAAQHSDHLARRVDVANSARIRQQQVSLLARCAHAAWEEEARGFERHGYGLLLAMGGGLLLRGGEGGIGGDGGGG